MQNDHSQMKTVRLLLVGGEDMHLRLDFIRRLNRRGYHVAAAAPPSPGQERLEAAGIEVLQYPLRRALAPLADWRAMRRLRDIMRTWRPDIIHAFDTKPTYLAPLAASGLSGPVVVRTITGMGRIFSSRSPHALALRGVHWLLHAMARKRVDHTIFQNSTDAAYFRRAGLVSAADMSLIRGSGIDIDSLRARVTNGARDRLRRELGLEGKTVFILVARLVAQKGVEEYLEAARILCAERDDVAFLLVGPSGNEEPDGVPTSRITAAKHVTYLGRRDDVPDLLTAADIFVLPTKYREGVPRAMLEAMALGRPVIVTDMPGCDEAVREGENGFLVRAGDAESLAAAMRAALAADLEKLGERANATVAAHYTMSTVVEETLRIYNTNLHNH